MTTTSVPGPGVDEQLRSAAPEEGRALLARSLRSVIAAILDVPSDSLDGAETLDRLGLDSLSALTLRRRVLAEVGIALPKTGIATLSLDELVDLGMKSALDTEPRARMSKAGAGIDPGQPGSAVRLPQLPIQAYLQRWPDYPFHTVPLAFEFAVAPEPRLVGEALQYLVARHEALRVRLVRDGEIVEQHIQPPQPLPLAERSVGSEEEVLQVAADLRFSPSDRFADTMIRCALVEVAPAKRHFLIVSINHLVSDAISRSILLEELPIIYASLSAGRKPMLPTVPTPYAEWVRRVSNLDAEAVAAASKSLRAVASRGVREAGQIRAIELPMAKASLHAGRVAEAVAGAFHEIADLAGIVAVQSGREPSDVDLSLTVGPLAVYRFVPKGGQMGAEAELASALANSRAMVEMDESELRALYSQVAWLNVVGGPALVPPQSTAPLRALNNGHLVHRAIFFRLMAQDPTVMSNFVEQMPLSGVMVDFNEGAFGLWSRDPGISDRQFEQLAARIQNAS